MTKTIHVHIGPHKTGSTAIQNSIRVYGDLLRRDHGLFPIDDSTLGRMAKALNQFEALDLARETEQLVNICHKQPGDCLISCEDLSGDLPGRTSKRKPYPRLWENVNFVRKAFSEFQCKFYFFVRDPECWIWSAYVQLLKHRRRFRSLEEYSSFLRHHELWNQTLKKPRSKLGADFIEIPYLEGAGFSSSSALFSKILGDQTNLDLLRGETRLNTSPDEGVVRILEALNGSGASPEAIQKAKHHLLSGETLRKPNPSPLRSPKWPPRTSQPEWLSPGLYPLWGRSTSRVHQQKQPNLLPERDCDLSKYRVRPVAAPDEFPEGGRQNMENQSRILRYRFRGLPETCYLLGLTISYLRRDTSHTNDAVFLFQRLWEEEYQILLGVLPTRWLISTFQTFMDHGINEAQRLIGSSSYFFSNIIKAYEAERAFEGLPSDSTYPNSVPVTGIGFAGMDRFKLGGSDLLLNVNALLLETAAQDPRAGRVVQEFMLRMKCSSTIFSRMDQSRLKCKIDIPQFSNCWSFFEHPDPRQSGEK